MNAEESSQSAELNTYHGNIDPSLSAGLGSFVIAHQPSLTHQPAEGAFHDPTAWQDGEAGGIVGAFDNLNGQFEAESPDPMGEGLTGVAAIHPQHAQPSEPTQHPAQYHFAPSRSVVLAGLTATPSTSPKVSTSKCRLRPLTHLPAS
jgi:hypothetical protein